jgi:elongation factor Ts
LAVEDVETLKKQDMAGKTVADTLTNLVATIGENMSIRRAVRLEVAQGIVAGYVHNAYAAGMGKIGVLVALETTATNTQRVDEVGRQIAMHIAAARPESLDVADLDQSLVERERSIFSDQARASGKPEEIIAKMVDGRLRKYYEEVVLLEQLFVVDGETKIRTVLEKLSTEVGAPVKLASFTRFAVGEGIEKEEKNLAAEVAATLGR